MLIFVITQCYMKFYSVQVQTWEIEINLGLGVYSWTNDTSVFTFSIFLMDIVFS